MIDDFSQAATWLAVASGQAQLKVASDPGKSGWALRLDFDFKGGAGFVAARKELSLRLPPAFACSFRIRGAAPKNKLEFKLADPTGQNVWRWQEEAFDLESGPRVLLLRNRDIEFAWGPAGGGPLHKVGAVEFVLSAGPGGSGTIWIDEFRLEDHTCRKKPAVTASGSARNSAPRGVLEGKAGSFWRSPPGEKRPWLQLDFHQSREYGGLIVDWEPRPAKRRFTVQSSDDGVSWRAIHRSGHSEGTRSFVYLPGGKSRFLRLAFEGPATVRHIAVQPFEFSRSLERFFHEVAAHSPRGWHPRWLMREQSYWTCAGVPDGVSCGLINEEGLIEPGTGSFSVEPFLHVNGELITWAHANREVAMVENDLPIPSATWKTAGLSLEITAFATGHRENAMLFARYRVQNLRRRVLKARLFVAIRPYQVNPTWQSRPGRQGVPRFGGVSPIHQIAWDGQTVSVNGERRVIPLTKPSAFGAAAFEQGVISGHLAEGNLPAAHKVNDAFGFASAAMRFDLMLDAGRGREVFVMVPFDAGQSLDARKVRQLASTDGPAQFDEAVKVMRERLGAVSFRVPRGVAQEAAHAFRTAAGQILINRDGPALQAGPRRYARSWIRDGAIMGAALLRIGDRQAMPEFIRWYARFQRHDGFVPCCVDREGPDWLVEHDSHGQFIFAVMESFRFNADQTFLKDMWPHVCQAARYIATLRARRLTPEYEAPEKLAQRGLLPESVSHEGYLAHPVHAYWDDFWALRGLRDAATMAAELGKRAEAAEFARQAASLRESLRISILTVISEKHLHYVPGSVEWADFDPSATANAIGLLQCLADLPAEPLNDMFALFVRDFRRKHGGGMLWANYSPYEIRIIGALVRLGRRADALELLKFFLSDRRPCRWNQWPEISWKNSRSPGHIGDVPHTWIAAEYMLAFVSLFVYEREADDALIVGAGVDPRWLTAPGGIGVQGLPTWHGVLDLAIKIDSKGVLLVELGGDVRVPRGGFIVQPPGDRTIQSVTVNGRAAPATHPHHAVTHEFPARMVVSFLDSGLC